MALGGMDVDECMTMDVFSSGVPLFFFSLSLSLSLSSLL
jgi:hypothetical protein